MAAHDGFEETGIIEDFTDADYFHGKAGMELSIGSGKDLTNPVISNFSPAPGTPISSTQVISFDVTDNIGLFTRIIIIARFGTTQEVVHDGSSFSFLYSNASCTVAPITNGFHYTVLRTGGWPSTMIFEPFAIDTDGNENV